MLTSRQPGTPEFYGREVAQMDGWFASHCFFIGHFRKMPLSALYVQRPRKHVGMPTTILVLPHCLPTVVVPSTAPLPIQP